MRPNHLLRLMELIDCTEDAAQIERWGRQSPLLGKYAWSRIVAIYSRRTGKIDRALREEDINDGRYRTVTAIAKRYDRC